MSNVDTLRGIPLFAGLSEAQLEEILTIIRQQCVPGNTVILSEGDRGEELFILATGSVEVTKRVGLGLADLPGSVKEKTLVRLNALQFFGEMGLLEDAERSATVTSLGECELLEINRFDFERLAGEDPLIGYLVVRNIAMVLSFRLRSTNLDVIKLTMALRLALGNR